MDRQYVQTLRVGITAILFALVFRLAQPDTVSFPEPQKTGPGVRFSPSFGTGFPGFVESPPPAVPKADEPALPVFSGEEDIALYYACSVEPDVTALLEKPLRWDLRQEEPTVLILSTHSTESYTQSGEPYVETSPWRTLDEHYNMLSIGDRVEQLLTEAGIGVLRDRELHDYPSYNGSYVHARKAIQKILAENPGIRLILDLHRDAGGEGGAQMRTLAQVEGRDSAQLMMVLGTNHEAFEENLSLGLKLHALLEAQAPGIMRPLQLRSQRFNQDLSPGALLVEVGAAGNTHAEALTAAEALAKAVIALAEGSCSAPLASLSEGGGSPEG